MSNRRYFNLSIPAPRRLAMMRADFANHSTKYPHCPEFAKPKSWRDMRETTFKGFAAYFGESDRGYSINSRGERIPCLYAHKPDTLPVRSMRDAHEVLTHLRHTGWYCDDDRDSLCIGIVASLPHGRFLAGFRLTDNGEYVLFLDRIFDHERDAAFAADSIAENLAETEREHNEKWREASTLDDEISESIEELRRARALHRANIADRIVCYGSSITGASLAAERALIRAARARYDAHELIERIREKREKRAAIDIET